MVAGWWYFIVISNPSNYSHKLLELEIMTRFTSHEIPEVILNRDTKID